MRKATPQDHPIKHCERCGKIYTKSKPYLTEVSKYCAKCCRLGPWNKGKKTGKPFTPRDQPDEKALAVKDEQIGKEVARFVMEITSYRPIDGAFVVGGRIMSFGEMITFANKHRTKRGLKQFGNNPAWHVTVPPCS